jgi:hypothetical protein
MDRADLNADISNNFVRLLALYHFYLYVRARERELATVTV